MPSIADYDKFFNEMEELQKKIEAQKKRGLNNLNPFTTVLKYHDEVRLHSRTIGALLNPQGEHYQDELFLEKFLEMINFKGLNLKKAKVYLEYKNIDIYITDGTKHIIIENKVWARDQHRQIERYIEEIKKENPSLIADDLMVIYLSIDRRNPSQYSLGNLEVLHNRLLDKSTNIIAIYQPIRYDEEIMKWLQNSKFEIQNITNLNVFIEAYIDVVKMLNNNYKGKVMTLSNKFENKKDYKLAMDICNELPAFREKTINDFFNSVKNKLEKRLGVDWIVEIMDTNKVKLSKPYNYPFRIYKKCWGKKRLIFGFQFDKEDYYGGYLFIRRFDDNIDINKDIIDNIKFNKDLADLGCIKSEGDAWLTYTKCKTYDFVEYILNNNEKDFFKKIMDMIDKYGNLVDDINTYLKTLP